MNTLLVDLMAGMVGGVAAVCAGQPLDTVKVKMQLYPETYGNMFKCLTTTARRQGLRGLYAGTCPAIVANVTDNAALFAAYGQCQRAVASAANVGDTNRLSYMQNAVAGGVTSLFTSSMLCPVELVKVRMQANAVGVRPAGEVLRDIWQQLGPRGFFRGLKATAARESVASATFFGVYEWARERLKPAGGRKEDCTVAATVAAGSAAGATSWLVVYPVDVVKTRTQKADGGVGVGGLRTILDEAGKGPGRASRLLAAFYSGLWPTLVKSIPVAGAMLYAVEFSRPFLRRKLADLQDGARAFSYRDYFSGCDFTSGWVAGVISTVFGHPMDTVRTVQQVTDTKLTAATRDVYARDKFKGYFRGMMFPMLSTGVLNAVCFGVNGNTKRLIFALRSDEADGKEYKDVRFCCDADVLKRFWHLDVFISGCVAGTFFSAINIPIEVVKTALQLSSLPSTPEQTKDVPKIDSPIKLITQLYKKNGMRSLYRGGTLLFIRDVPSMGVYMLAYEHFCCKLKVLWNSVEGVPEDDRTQPQSMRKIVQIISGGLAGVLSWITVIPIDVIKSKVLADDPARPKFNGAWDCVLKTYRLGGLSHFFRGFWVLSVRAFIVNGIMFVTYEMLLKACNQRAKDNESGAVRE